MTPEGEIAVKKHHDGSYQVIVPQNLDPNATFASQISHVEIRPNGEIVLTKDVFDGGNLPGNTTVVDRGEHLTPAEFDELTESTISFGENGIELHPDVRARIDALLQPNDQAK